jgi:MFS family permease
MNPLIAYVLSLALTLLFATLLTLLLRTALQRVLIDLCGTRERAHFWSLYAMLMLIAMPLVIGMGFNPQEPGGQALFFEVANQLRGNLLGYLFALAIVGGFISVFSLFAPRPKPTGT